MKIMYLNVTRSVTTLDGFVSSSIVLPAIAVSTKIKVD